VYRHGYRCPCDPWNKDSYYKIVLKHDECISADTTKRPRVRAQQQAVVMFMKNLPWWPYKGKNNDGESELAFEEAQSGLDVTYFVAGHRLN
jgi:hypothetical protein